MMSISEMKSSLKYLAHFVYICAIFKIHILKIFNWFGVWLNIVIFFAAFFSQISILNFVKNVVVVVDFIIAFHHRHRDTHHSMVRLSFGTFLVVYFLFRLLLDSKCFIVEKTIFFG